MVLAFLPGIVYSFPPLYDYPPSATSFFYFFFSFLTYGVFFVIMLKTVRGYVVIGVTDETLRMALHDVLRELELPFEETLSKLRLTTLDADLEANVASWIGTAQISIRQPQHVATMERIAQGLGKHFASSRAHADRTMSIYYIVFGVLITAIGIFLIVNNARTAALINALR